ncbi:MAG: N-acetylmuramoyl-L-alanine amidase [Verrucomicrobiota bacterium]
MHKLSVVKILGLLPLVLCALLPACSTCGFSFGGQMPPIRMTLLPPDVHGRLVKRTMTPRYITIHATENPNATAGRHALYLSNKGKRSGKHGRSGWVTWHFTVDDREIVEHLLPTEQGDHADFGGKGDHQSIAIEICEFSDPRKQAAAIDRASRLAAALAERYKIPNSHILPHKHWPRWDFAYGKPCPKILLSRDTSVPGGWRLGPKWKRFIAQVDRYR